MRTLKYYLFLLLYYAFSLVFASQAAAMDDFYPIMYPGKSSLFYSYEHSKDEQDETFLKVAVNNDIFHIYGNAVKPSIQSLFLLENLVIYQNEDVLDIGTGSGIQAIYAARKSRYVVATDIGEDAIKSAKVNVKRFGLEKKIEVRLGDLFEPIKTGERFDVIINNINYPEEMNDQENEMNSLWKVHARFFREVKAYLKPGGRIYYQSGFLFNVPRVQKLIKQNDLQVMQMNMIVSIPHKKEIIFYMVKRRAF